MLLRLACSSPPFVVPCAPLRPAPRCLCPSQLCVSDTRVYAPQSSHTPMHAHSTCSCPWRSSCRSASRRPRRTGERAAMRGAAQARETARAQKAISRSSPCATRTLIPTATTGHTSPRRQGEGARSNGAETSAPGRRSSGSNKRQTLRPELRASRAHLRPMNICAPGSG